VKLIFIVYRYLYSASHGVSQTEAVSVHFSSRKKVRLKARERRGKGSREIKRAKRRREVILEWRTNRSKGPSVGNDLCSVCQFRLVRPYYMTLCFITSTAACYTANYTVVHTC